MKPFIIALATALLPLSAVANIHEGCEIVIVKEVVDSDGGRMTVAAYKSAADFIKAAKSDAKSVSLEDDGAPIRGVICVRNDLVPAKADYAILATGVPLSLSQNFDSADSDILTVYFENGQFTHRYTSDYPMSSEFEDALNAQLKDFTARNHGLVKPTEINN
ncbi:MAG: hypothetical protein AAFP97_06645 [Pseudomonadota bacterium]